MFVFSVYESNSVRLTFAKFRFRLFHPVAQREASGTVRCFVQPNDLASTQLRRVLSTTYGRGQADIHHGPESLTPLKAEYIGADQLPSIIFRLHCRGGPYIPIIPFIMRLSGLGFVQFGVEPCLQMCFPALAPPGAMHLGHDFAEPRKLRENLPSLHPYVTYLELVSAIDVGENM